MQVCCQPLTLHSPLSITCPAIFISFDSLTRRNSVVEALVESEHGLHTADAALSVAM